MSIAGHSPLWCRAEPIDAAIATVLDCLPEAVVAVGGDQRIESLNSAAERLFGYTSAELAGQDFATLIPSCRAIASLMRQEPAAQLRYGHEVIALRKDGSEFPADVGVREVRLGGRSVFVAFACDLSWRKRNEEERKRGLSLLKAQQEALPDGIVVLDENRRVISVSRRFLEIWGIPAGIQDCDLDFLLAHLGSCLQEPAAFARRAEALFSSWPQQAERGELRLKDGRVIECFSAPAVSPEGRHFGRIWYHRDVTHHKLAEEKTLCLLQENRLLTSRLINAQEEERRNLARELHDELGQALTAIKADAVWIGNRSRDGLPEIHKASKSVVSVVDGIYAAVHAMMRRLRPSMLDDLGLADALHALVAGWRTRHPWIRCHLHLSHGLDDLGETVNITLYRIVQECLTNVARHAAASQVNVSLSREPTTAGTHEAATGASLHRGPRLGPIREAATGPSLARGPRLDPIGEEADAPPGRVHLVVRDDGRGMPPERLMKSPGTFGLLGIRERVGMLGGNLRVESAIGRGAIIEADIPLGDNQ